MAYEVCWTAHARADLEVTIAYISEALCSPQVAREHLDAFLKAANALAENSELYAVSAVGALQRRGLRACFVKNYVLVHGFDGEKVTVNRIFHMRQNYTRLIRQ